MAGWYNSRTGDTLMESHRPSNGMSKAFKCDAFRFARIFHVHSTLPHWKSTINHDRIVCYVSMWRRFNCQCLFMKFWPTEELIDLEELNCSCSGQRQRQRQRQIQPHHLSSLLIMLGCMLRTALKLLHAPFWPPTLFTHNLFVCSPATCLQTLWLCLIFCEIPVVVQKPYVENENCALDARCEIINCVTVFSPGCYQTMTTNQIAATTHDIRCPQQSRVSAAEPNVLVCRSRNQDIPKNYRRVEQNMRCMCNWSLFSEGWVKPPVRLSFQFLVCSMMISVQCSNGWWV